MVQSAIEMQAEAQSTTGAMTRRQALAALGVLGLGTVVGCAPVKILLNTYPEEFNAKPDLSESMLRSFVETVIPGASGGDRKLVQIYYDDYYPFAKHRNYFAADLCRRAERKFGEKAFDRLTVQQRTAVIQDGLDSDKITARLYNGAIFLAQISFYAGIYDDETGCELIGFEGQNWGVPYEIQTHPNPEKFLATPMTATGNFI